MSDERETPASEDFAAMFANQQTGPVLEVGQVVRGRVIQIAAEAVFVDVGAKGEAPPQTDAGIRIIAGVACPGEPYLAPGPEPTFTPYPPTRGAPESSALRLSSLKDLIRPD